MIKYYFTFVLFFFQFQLNTTSTCHLYLDQTSHSQQSNHFYADQYSQNFHSQGTNLLNYSAHDLKRYFEQHHCSAKDILAYDFLYMSDEFVQFAKTLPGYKNAVENLYHILNATNCSALCERIAFLYKQLQWQERSVSKQAEKFASNYNINLFDLFPDDNSIVMQQLYQKYMHILHEASFIPHHNSIMRDSIGEACHIGLEANKSGHTKQASQLADFCSTILDLSKAFGEGIYVGTINSIDTFKHPIQTLKNGLIGIGVIACGLGALTTTTAECVCLYTIDNNRYFVRQREIVTYIDKITKNTEKKLASLSTRDFVRQGSAFFTEALLCGKICSFVHKMTKQLLPLTKKYVECIAKKSPTSLIADGIVYVETIAERLMPSNLLQKIKNMFCKKLKPLGRGNTGRSMPKDLREQLVMEEIMADPYLGKIIEFPQGMTDSRWHKNDGWEKMRWRHENIEIHFVAQWINNIITAIDDFKFKNIIKGIK